MNKYEHYYRRRSFHTKPAPKPKPGSFLSKNSTRNVNYRHLIVQLTRTAAFQSEQINRLNKRIEELEKPLESRHIPYHLTHLTNYMPNWWEK